ncbi:MAG: hypothetical protein EHM42_08990 [Planctomycetaceae bacterium]|nr:MAG: hypothetical protein EHM42_08990 [Planctomycetaceae bacterium]
MATGKVITALVYDERPINEPKPSQLARLPDGCTQIDAVIVTSQGVARDVGYKANVSIVGTDQPNGTRITTRSKSGLGNGDPEWTPPQKAGGAVGEIVADISQTWEIEWNPDLDQPWGGGIFSGTGVRPEDNFVYAGVDLTVVAAAGGVVSAAVILIARNAAGETLTWPGEWIARAS